MIRYNFLQSLKNSAKGVQSHLKISKFYYIIVFENIRIHPIHTLSDSFRIYFFQLQRADLKMSGFAAEFAVCVWKEAVSGKKKMQIKKYRILVDGALNFLLIFFKLPQ